MVMKALKFLYAYTTQSYIDLAALGQRGLWIKVGETTQESTDVRIAQQDGTSNAEPLLKLKEWKIPNWLTDKTVHKELIRMGCKFVRVDKDREWLECTIEQVSSAINNLVHGVSRPNNWKMRLKRNAPPEFSLTNLFETGVSEFLRKDINH